MFKKKEPKYKIGEIVYTALLNLSHLDINSHTITGIVKKPDGDFGYLFDNTLVYVYDESYLFSTKSEAKEYLLNKVNQKADKQKQVIRKF